MNLTVEKIAPHRRPELGVFAGKEAWIFDLDNTLYPRSTNLFKQVDGRIRAYVRRLLDVDEDEAHALVPQLAGRRQADARRPTRDHGDPVSQLVHR